MVAKTIRCAAVEHFSCLFLKSMWKIDEIIQIKMSDRLTSNEAMHDLPMILTYGFEKMMSQSFLVWL